MAFTARDASRTGFPIDLRHLPGFAPATSARLGYGEGDALTVRAMMGAGLAALVGLPPLLVASAALSAPLAAPAAIACFYLAVAFAFASRQPRRATRMYAVVLSLLVGWSAISILSGSEPVSWTVYAAALMAPLFAVAPALARFFLGAPPAPTPIIVRPLPQPAAQAPRPATGRLSPAASETRRVPTHAAPQFACDIGAAASFALHRIAGAPIANGVDIDLDMAPAIVAACDRQTGRRIVHAMLECALVGSHAGDSVRLSARRLRGVVLLRVSLHALDCDPISDLPEDPASVARVRTLVEQAGGTMMADCEADGICISVRLDPAAARMAEEN